MKNLLLLSVLFATTQSQGGGNFPAAELYAGVISGQEDIFGQEEGIFIDRDHDVYRFPSLPQKTHLHKFYGQGILGVMWHPVNSGLIFGFELAAGGSFSKHIQDYNINIAGHGGPRQVSFKFQQTVMIDPTIRIGYFFSGKTIIYGTFGLSMGKFKYSFIHESFNLGNSQIRAFSRARSFWQTAPFLGIGVERRINNFNLGLDMKYVFSRPYNISHLITHHRLFADEYMYPKFKRRSVRLGVRITYVF